MTKPWVFMDLSFLAHRARYALTGMSWEDYPTGVLFGFFEQFKTICTDDRIRSNRVVFFFDSRKSYRRLAFPDYKKGRNVDLTPEEKLQMGAMYDQVTLLRKFILPAMGLQVHRQTGCESDDLMAMAAKQFTGPTHQATIVTADGDLFQCITDAVHWYDPARHLYFTPESFRLARGISPDKWGMVKAVAGCDGDAVPGVPGVGEKTAVDYLLGRLPHTYKRHKNIISIEGNARVSRNMDLVVLPHPKTKPFTLQEPDYRPEGFFEACKRYGMMSYLKEPKRSEWEAFLHSGPVQTRQRGGLMS